MSKPVRTITDRRQAHVARNRAAGLCATCGQPCTGYRCGPCNERRRAAQKLLMQQRRADNVARGLCADCGKPSAEYRCGKCRASWEKRQKKYHPS